MGFDLRETHQRAMAIQPAIDEAFEEKLDELLGSPTVDPHGRPIPARNVTWPRLEDAPLVDLPAGTSGLVSRITSEDAEAIEYLAAQGLTAGTHVVLESLAPFDGPVSVKLGRRTLHLGRRLARLVSVEKAAPAAKTKKSADGSRGRR
jgi:DtxR family Mn-dependent transcriptional regulator